ncbi:hypothetical protein JG687_00019537 [Phytophthora cactorum]|uniref:Uncharacterized protein n=1 Tax=Phytophthora cactorum TaxID=29920 RepID=A0A8T1TIW3_9STRA|nr:hypothetical protein PC120_g2075 [Phytophthora cactorum]KAG6941627.1 hypothetical protein JG687_00019537 [Phytophthora cactorum]
MVVSDLREITTPQLPLSQWGPPKVVTVVTPSRPASYRMSYELTSTVNDVTCVSVLMPLNTCGDDTSVIRALVPPSNIFGASVAASLTLAASLIPFESNALITEFTIDEYADTYGMIRGVTQRCRQ